VRDEFPEPQKKIPRAIFWSLRRVRLCHRNIHRRIGLGETKRLIAAEMPRLRGYARRLETDHDAAEDLLQDALERAIRKRHLWKGRGSIRAWLYRLLFNVFANRYARRNRERGKIPLDDAPVLYEPARQEQGLICLDIAAAVGRLPDEQRRAISLTASQDITYEDAARLTGVPVGTFRSRLSRGRERLRENVQEEPAETVSRRAQ
jgi:RNA polymerase sigma-70 factor, ECF subfamily